MTGQKVDVCRQCGGVAQNGLRVFVDYIRHQQPQRAEHTGAGRDQNFLHAQTAPQIAGVERPRAAKGDEGKGPRVVAPFHRDSAQGTLHCGVGNADDAQSCFLGGITAQFIAQAGQRCQRGGSVQPHCARPAQKIPSVQPPQY